MGASTSKSDELNKAKILAQDHGVDVNKEVSRLDEGTFRDFMDRGCPQQLNEIFKSRIKVNEPLVYVDVVYSLFTEPHILYKSLLNKYDNHFNLVNDIVKVNVHQLEKFYKVETDEDSCTRITHYILKCQFKRSNSLNEEFLSEFENFVEISQTKIEDPKLERFYSPYSKFSKLFRQAFETLLLDQNYDTSGLPNIPQVKGKLSLDVIYLMVENLSEDCLKEWRLVYDSERDGKSWNKLQSGLVSSNSTFTLVQELDTNHQFGFHSYMRWRQDPKFYGNGKSLLFSVRPSLDCYLSSGYNTNYQYLNSNSHTLTNGLALGGQHGYYGLFLEQGLIQGQSMANPLCSTYNSPQLSAHPTFQIGPIQVWSVRELEEEEESNQKSILDTNPEAAAMLEMTSHKMYSKDIREPNLE